MKITVITATYNSAGTLRDTMDSVLRQTFQDYEYIVVDGASHDQTLDIVRQYEPRFGGRLRYISEPDEGLYDAMNKGIGMATGDVVGLLNSDDFYTADDVLQTVADAYTADATLDAVYGDIHYVRSEAPDVCVRYYCSKVFKRKYMRFGLMPAHPSFYCRRDCYDRFGRFDTEFKISADFENLLRMIYIGNINTRYIAKDFVTMRMGGASTSGPQSVITIMREHLAGFRKNGIRTNGFLLSLRYFLKAYEFVRR